MVDFDMIRAYKSVYDENGDMDDLVAQKAGSRLLRSVAVQRYIDEYECNYLAEKKLEKDRVILQIQRMYTNSMRDRDYSNAGKALDMLAKHFGLYKAHNQQKKYNVEDVQALRLKLECHGVSFDAPNKPNVLEMEQAPIVNTTVVPPVVEEQKVKEESE